MRQEDLLDKYYRGETSPEEEKELKTLIIESDTDSVEKDLFGYFKNESFVPDDLEESLFSGLTEKNRKTKIMKIRFFSIVSAAAAVVIIVSIFLNLQTKKNTLMENNFLVMEQALYQVSESIQPEEEKEMLVLWVDNDVEIIIN